jgi:integrase
MNAKVWTEKTGNTLRLVWYYQGKRQRLSLGVFDNPVGRAFAAKKMADIKIDLASGYYDQTLLKYRPRKLGTNPTEITAVELFEKYSAFTIKDKGLAPRSIDLRRSRLRGCLKRGV